MGEYECIKACDVYEAKQKSFGSYSIPVYDAQYGHGVVKDHMFNVGDCIYTEQQNPPVGSFEYAEKRQEALEIEDVLFKKIQTYSIGDIDVFEEPDTLTRYLFFEEITPDLKRDRKLKEHMDMRKQPTDSLHYKKVKMRS